MHEDLADVERELCRIPDVRAARIVADAAGQPIEVHVLAVPGKHAKQIVRDVQSVAMATHGLSIDHRIVSVVQLDDAVGPASPAGGGPAAAVAGEPEEPAGSGHVIVLDPPATGWRTPEDDGRSAPGDQAAPPTAGHPTASAPPPRGRVVVERVLVLRRGLTCTAEVVLRADDEIVTGDADGSAAASSTLRLIAEATVDALRQLRPVAEHAYVESASVARVGDRAIALTSLVLVIPPNEDLVTGSAPVRHAGEHEAVARAVLDAMNRRLQGQRVPSPTSG